MIFWDTSAFLKCYAAAEADHARALNLLTREKGHKGCAMLPIETISGLVRKSGANRALRDSLLAQAQGHLDTFDLLPLDRTLVDLGSRLVVRHALRAADAIHIAAALLLARDIGRRTLHFATADAEQASAAAGERLKVLRLAL